ncbi:hydantoinase/oxoprolinase family protein [Mesorhizobium sp.]|uniref:hydantoinase/oxoprolinase family protein n=1 Tax=Mesorhizobium sp. TaxID=1871066 RepID=UPI0025CDA0E7|nr:hydantoinase/oxoprolinase family protein [Mesorhizobium sp.]
MWQFWVDRGGTFTDTVARTPEGEAEDPQAAVRNPRELAGVRIRAPIMSIHTVAAGGGSIL